MTPRQWLFACTAGLLLWASSFVVLYAGLALGCEASWHTRRLAGANLLTLALALAWLAHLLALAVLWWWLRRRTPHRLGQALTLVAVAATLWTGWPALALPPCAGQSLALHAHEETVCSRI